MPLEEHDTNGHKFPYPEKSKLHTSVFTTSSELTQLLLQGSENAMPADPSTVSQHLSVPRLLREDTPKSNGDKGTSQRENNGSSQEENSRFTPDLNMINNTLKKTANSPEPTKLNVDMQLMETEHDRVHQNHQIDRIAQARMQLQDRTIVKQAVAPSFNRSAEPEVFLGQTNDITSAPAISQDSLPWGREEDSFGDGVATTYGNLFNT